MQLIKIKMDFIVVADELVDSAPSPGREVSPKYVYGTKKYGRKSRPASLEIDDNENTFNKDTEVRSENFTVEEQVTTPMDECTGQCNIGLENVKTEDDCEIRTQILEWTAALWDKLTKDEDGFIDYEQFENLCHSLQESDCSTELCDLLDTLLTIKKWKIDFKTFFSVIEEYFTSGNQIKHDIIQTDDAVESGIDLSGLDETQADNIQLSSASIDSSMLSILDPQCTGLVEIDRLIEILEGFGIQNTTRILESLGISSLNPVRLEEFAALLEEEVSSLDECTNINLLKTTVACFIHEIRRSRSTLDQVVSERDKLKQDVIEANQHSTLLAQEMDEHNIKLENKTKTHIRELENKHADELREVQQRLKLENDKFMALKSAFDQEVDKKMLLVKDEENRLKQQLQLAQEELTRMEKEQMEMNAKLQNCDKTIAHQQKQLDEFPLLENKLLELQCNKMMVPKASYQDVLVQLEQLHFEKKELKDENDELISELSNLRAKLVSESGPSNCGLKRRGSQFSAEEISWDSSVEDDISVKVKKVRQQDNKTHDMDDMFRETDSSNDQVLEISPGDGCRTEDKEVQVCLTPPQQNTAVISTSEGCTTFHHHICNMLVDIQNVYKIVEVDVEPYNKYRHCVLKQLQAALHDVLPKPKMSYSTVFQKIANSNRIEEEMGEKEFVEKKFYDCLYHHLKLQYMKGSCCSTDDYLSFLLSLVIHRLNNSNGSDKSKNSCEFPPLSDLITSCYSHSNIEESKEESIDKIDSKLDTLQLQGKDYQSLLSERDELTERCLNLENSLHLLKDEYDNCEEYWKLKLDEERDFNDQQQVLMDQKIQDLQLELDKLQDFDLLCDKAYPLSTIDERVEEQVTELEAECQKLSERLIHLETEKASIESDLKSQLYEQALAFDAEKVTLLKKIDDYEFKLSTLTRELNLSMEDSSKIQAEYEHQLHCLRRLCKVFRSDDKVMSPSDISNEASLRLSRQLQLYKYPKSHYFVVKSQSCPGSLDLGKGATAMPLEPMPDSQPPVIAADKISCTSSDMALIYAMSNRLRHQEARCRKLEMALENQQLHMDKILLETSRQYKEEMVNFEKMMGSTKEILHKEFSKYRPKFQKEKCSSREVLMKELLVENCNLIQALQISRQRHSLAEENVRKLEEQLALFR